MFVDINVISTLAMHVEQSSSLQRSVFFYFIARKQKKQKRSQQVYYGYRIHVLHMTVYMYMTIYV